MFSSQAHNHEADHSKTPESLQWKFPRWKRSGHGNARNCARRPASWLRSHNAEPVKPMLRLILVWASWLCTEGKKGLWSLARIYILLRCLANAGIWDQTGIGGKSLEDLTPILTSRADTPIQTVTCWNNTSGPVGKERYAPWVPLTSFQLSSSSPGAWGPPTDPRAT